MDKQVQDGDYDTAMAAQKPGFDTPEALVEAFCTSIPIPPTVRDERMEARAERGTVQVEGLTLHTYRWGDPSDPLVILVHGWRSRASHMGAFTLGLVRAGLQVAALDMPAHGRSAESPGARTTTHMKEWVRVLRRVVPELADRIGQPVQGLAGHSIGAAALAFSTSHLLPELGPTLEAERLALVSAPFRLQDIIDVYAAQQGWTAEEHGRLAEGLKRVLDVSVETYDLLPHTAGLPASLLLVHDPSDEDASYHVARLVHRYRPDAQFLTTQEAGHARTLVDKQAIAALCAFMA